MTFLLQAGMWILRGYELWGSPIFLQGGALGPFWGRTLDLGAPCAHCLAWLAPVFMGLKAECGLKLSLFPVCCGDSGDDDCNY